MAATGLVRHALALWFLGPRLNEAAISQSAAAAPQQVTAEGVAATKDSDARKAERASDTSVIAELG